MDSSLLPFFKPRGVVVIGASTSPEKLGYGVARNLVQSGYPGAIHFVSQKQGQLFHRPVYTDLAQVPDPVDLAVIIVRPHNTPDALRSCGQRGVHAAIIISAGFREAGREGARLEAECLQLARMHNIRLLGPNCIGTLDTHYPLDTTFVQPPMPALGSIGFISHSGAFCAAVIDWARRQGFGFSQLVSLGNQADVNETDILPMLAADSQTRVIVMYMEGITDGRRFVEVAGEVTRHKPVVALKVGRGRSGQKAAASHTGALAASDTAFEAGFTKAGILRADTTEQMFDWARALDRYPLPRSDVLSLSKGRRIAILTNAGGPGVIAVDSLETNGLSLAQLSESTLRDLSADLPPAASVHNPVDMLASASPETYATCLQLLLVDVNVDGVILILPPPPMFTTEDVADAIIPIIQESDKPVITALMGSELTAKALERFNSENIPTYPFPERAVSAMYALVKRAEYLAVEQALETPKAFRVSEPKDNSIEELLASYGIPVAQLKLARSEEEAASISAAIGFPAVLKIASPDIPHKSDVSGVLLNIQTREDAHSGYKQLIELVKTMRPAARVEGVYVQRQIPQGQEVIAGMVRDPQFGPLIMFGSGGVEVEGLKDVAFALAPLNSAEAESLLRKTWAGRKLKGFRNIPAADQEAVKDVLIQLSWLAMEHPEIEEIDINPLRVLTQGAVAVDIRVKLRG